ncbi:RICIN domain-containing protein [Crossiella sp. SN42]|uniref:RICIN domain-containing protein n=1 Tax=Crossiella sp. SN42 TaxID=2944808 RepID=UPI00207CCED7|nr:RICIN domain-containing protein [Crossiella sp. SN42]MCO1581915.1 RICIN domain-containing protein [Crossiella sp. SN42]
MRVRITGVLAVACMLLAGMTAVIAPRPAQALEDGVARTPPMGWNTWNTFGCDISETLIRQTVDALAGLPDLWTGATSSTTGSISAVVPAHGTAVFRVSGGGLALAPATFPLRSESADRCLDSPKGGGAQQQITRNSNTLQLLGMCLETAPNAAAGAKVQLRYCNGGTNQQWNLNGNGTISNVRTGLCLDVDNNGTLNGTPVIGWHCHDAANQRWTRR